MLNRSGTENQFSHIPKENQSHKIIIITNNRKTVEEATKESITESISEPTRSGSIRGKDLEMDDA